MAAELKDLRCKIPVETWCYLEAESRVTQSDICEVVREVLGNWAARRHEMAIQAQRLLDAQGMPGAAAGASWNRVAKLKWE